MRTPILGICALLLVMMDGPSWAQSPLTFEQVLELVERENPIVESQEASLRVTHALITQAGATPNPTLHLQTQTDGTERLSLIGLGISKPFELGHKRKARIQAAELAHEEAEQEKEERLHLLHFELRKRFLDILLAQSHQALAVESVGIVERHLAIAEKRLTAGDISGAEVASLRVERERRVAREAVTIGQTRQAISLLGEFVAEQGPLQAGVVGDLGWRSDLPSFETLLSEDLIGLRVARAKERKEGALVTLERANGVSDLTVQAGVYMQRMVFPGTSFSPAGSVARLDDTGPLVQLQLQIPLPLGNDNSGNIAAAKARREKASFEIEATRRRLQAELEGLYRKVLSQNEARQRLEQQAKPAALSSLESVEKAYALGFRSQVDLLLARDTYLLASEAIIEAAYSESLTIAELENLLGYSLTTKEDTP